MNTKFKLQHKLFGLFTVFAIMISGLITLIFYHAAYTKVHEDIRHRLRDIVSIAAANIDLTTHAKLQKTEQEGSESYRAIKISLQKIRDASTDILYIYTMRYDINQKITLSVKMS
ncbi:MAG: hypothetical protein U9N77_07630 [Thermodesulfobacteriota bacterium]|nr:hypothetical protein [Thermodesulfobacteriota bacterium]